MILTSAFSISSSMVDLASFMVFLNSRMALPKVLAKSGNYFGPNNNNTTTKIKTISGNPIEPNMVILPLLVLCFRFVLGDHQVFFAADNFQVFFPDAQFNIGYDGLKIHICIQSLFTALDADA